MSVTTKIAGSILVSALVISSWVLIYRRKRRKQKHETPHNNWQRIGVVKQLAIYPLKSAAPIQLEQGVLTSYGVKNKHELRDRCLVVLTEDFKLTWAGSYPHMLSIEPQQLDDQRLLLKAPNELALAVDIAAIIANGKAIKKWSKFDLIPCDEEHDCWISRVVLHRKRGLRLFVALNGQTEHKWWQNKQSNTDFQPVMVLHEKSLVDLNARLLPENRADAEQFRANFVVASDEHIEAYDEDDWLWMRVGRHTILKYTAPCLRCILPNVNVKTCKRNPNFEPLKTLKTYRLRDNPKEPEMGVYFQVYQEGLINNGDEVYVQYRNR